MKTTGRNKLWVLVEYESHESVIYYCYGLEIGSLIKIELIFEEGNIL